MYIILPQESIDGNDVLFLNNLAASDHPKDKHKGFDIYIYTPSNGWCLNPKGLLNGTLSHPFGTPWRVHIIYLPLQLAPIVIKKTIGDNPWNL